MLLLPNIYVYPVYPRARLSPSLDRPILQFLQILLVCLLLPLLCLPPPFPFLLLLSLPLLFLPPVSRPFLLPLLLFPPLFLPLSRLSRCLLFLPRPFPLLSPLRLSLPLLSLLPRLSLFLLSLRLFLALPLFPLRLFLLCRLSLLRLRLLLLLPLLLYGHLEQCIMLRLLSLKLLRCRLDRIFCQMFGTAEARQPS